MKQIDKLMLKSFIGPFLVSFGVALFVLIMQFLWLYIDEIAGKGVSIFIMLELIGYLSVSTFPMALPIGVLIASVMVLGNLAERYELSSLKSAGVSLLRTIRPLVFTCVGISVFSYVCSDYLIPKANLKFRSRLFDIRKQKPALSIEKGTFNEDFRQFVIRVGDKEKDGETIGQVMIEDQTNNSRVKFNQILADSGQMFTSTDKRFFVMNLFNGAQYQEPGSTGTSSKQKYPFIRTNFKSWSKVWDMSEFDMNVTDEERFSKQRSMLSISQLQVSLDSLIGVIGKNRQEMASEMLINIKRQPLLRPQPQVPRPDTIQRDTARRTLGNNLQLKQRLTDRGPAAASSTSRPVAAAPLPKDKKVKVKPKATTPVVSPSGFVNQPFPPGMPIQDTLTQEITTYGSFLATFAAKNHQKLAEDGLKQLKLNRTSIENRKEQINNIHLEWAKTGYELYTKHSFALVCIVFLFIGGPMGAIIRKGGFGYPILVSIIFFVTFIFLTILCRKLAESFVLTPFWAAMTPCIVMLPIATFLTRRAQDDIQLLSTERFDRLGRWITKRFQRKEVVPPQL